MGWTLDELLALPVDVYDELFEIVKEQHERAET